MQNAPFERAHRRHIQEINIVPILDMLTVVIFFLLLSTSFMEYTKVTVPPSRVQVNTDPIKPPPLQPRLSVTFAKNQYHLLLHWSGAEPGQKTKSVTLSDESEARELTVALETLVSEFKTEHPNEKTLQLGLGAQVPYESLIVAMDAVRKKMPDVVLYSYNDAESEWQNKFESKANP